MILANVSFVFSSQHTPLVLPYCSDVSASGKDGKDQTQDMV